MLIGSCYSVIANVSPTLSSTRIKIAISGSQARAIAAAGHVTLSEEHINELIGHLESYVYDRRYDIASNPTPAEKKHEKTVSKLLGELLDEFSDFDRKTRVSDQPDVVADLDHKSVGSDTYDDHVASSDQILFWRARIGARAFIAQLKMLKQCADDRLEDGGGPGGRPPNLFLPEFMAEMNELYMKAGGRSVGVSKDDSTGRRASPFVSFVWAALLLCPSNVRPLSEQALMSSWERQSRRRKSTAAS